MKIKLSRSYKKIGKNGNVNTVFVYHVTGTKEQLAAFKTAQGDNFRESEEGVALWFTTRCAGNSGNLLITSANKIVADMSAFDQADSLAKQYGGNLGTELAKAAAAQLMGSNVATGVNSTAPVEAEKKVADL